MFAASKLFLDHKIDRRAFIRRVTAAGVSLAGATAIAETLAGQEGPGADAVSPEKMPGSAKGPGRVVKGMTGGELTAEFLIDWDIPYVFGLAGSEEVGFLDALVDRVQLQYATCLHENVAMAMADGYSRSTGRTPIVQLHSVAGAAYALGQLVNTSRDRVPVVVTAGRQSADFRGQDGFLEAANLHELPRDYSQWIWDVMHPATIPEVLRRAFLLSEAPPGGPVFVTFSKDMWELRVAEVEILPRARSRVSVDVAPREAHVKKIADALEAAELPVLFLGNETIRYEISAEVAGIAETLGALVMTSAKIPAVFPTTHPNFAGHFLDDRSITGRIDAFWSLGAPLFKHPARSAQPLVSRSATLMHTSLVPSEVGRNYPVDVASIAGIKATSGAVLAELRKRRLNTTAVRDRRRWVENYTAKRRGDLQAAAEKEAGNKPIAVSRLMTELDRQMDPGAYIVSELVSADSYIRKYVRIDHTLPYGRRRRNFDTTGGVLGWALAASIGVKIGNPEKEVWCLTSDGALNFGCQALWSAVRYEVPIGIVLFNNGQYQTNRLTQNLYQGRMVETGKYIGVQLGHPDINYISLADAYGVEAERVEEPEDLAAAITRCSRAMQEGRPYLLDVVIDTFSKGRESTWYDHFSIARGIPRQT